MSLFAAALIAHVLLWRFVRVKREIFWLFMIFLLCPLLLVPTVVVSGHEGTKEAIAIALVHISLAFVYIQTYPGLREDIPSIRILKLVHSQPDGMNREDILSQLDGARFLETKIDDLENDVLIVTDRGVLRLTPVGTFLAVIFGLYRRLLRTPSGRG